MTVVKAIQFFLGDERSRHLSKNTQRKSQFFLEKQLKTWAAQQSLIFLDQLVPAELMAVIHDTAQENREAITEDALEKALAPIRAFYTRKGNAAGMKFPALDSFDS